MLLLDEILFRQTHFWDFFSSLFDYIFGKLWSHRNIWEILVKGNLMRSSAHDEEEKIKAPTPKVSPLAELEWNDSTSLNDPDKRLGKKTFFLSHAQESLWFIDRSEQIGSAYHTSFRIQLNGPLNEDLLKKTLEVIVTRHEPLRTTISKLPDGTLQQVIHPAGLYQLKDIYLSAIVSTSSPEEIEFLINREIHLPFDLTSDLMLRAALIHVTDLEHILILTIHHIASDGWSAGILFREISQIYKAFYFGKPLDIPDLPLQYINFTQSQMDQLKGKNYENLLSYWQGRLAKVPKTLQLPTDRSRPSRMTFIGDRERFRLPKELSLALTAISRQNKVSFFMTLLGAFNVLLCRYTNSIDVTIGSPFANRTKSDWRNLIGFFVNTLVLRTDLSNDPTFLDLLKRLREVCIGAFGHSEMPFEKLVEVLNPKRDASYSPLFQVMFNFQNTPQDNFSLPGLDAKVEEIDNGTAKNDLTLELRESNEGLQGFFEYNSDLFDRSTIHRMIGHFRTLLEAIAEQPNRRISKLPLLTQSEKKQLLEDWNQTQADYPAACIHELFEAQAEKTPDAVALVCEEEQVTYRELNCRANQVAHHLRGLGVKTETLVAISLKRSLKTVIGLLGILKAGGAYVPLDPSYPKERLAFMLEDSKATILLTQEKLKEELPASEVMMVCLDSDREIISSECRENPTRWTEPDNLAYVIYTSGSTGKPKGVLGVHGATINRFAWMWETYPFKSGEVVCQKTALSFVDSVWEIFGPLLQGIPSWIIPDNVVKDPIQLIKSLANGNVTRIVMVPSLLRALFDSTINLKMELPDLMVWFTSGEALSLELAQRFKENLPHAKMINLYGSSEVSADSTFYEIGKDDSFSSVPIGQPIANSYIYILDTNLDPVPIGVPGELHIGGAGLARGYLNRPELTAEKFIPNHLSDAPGERLYKTGDLARYLPDGNVEFLGRIDHQVKIRGFRMELGEIETVLRNHAAVREAVVMAREDSPGDKCLAAYIVVHHQPAPSTSEFHNHLKEHLPEYMVPSTFTILDSLPLTPNGKVDRRALPTLDWTRPELEGAFVAPRTEVEKDLTRIWCDVLGLDRIGIHDNFFELGGHSLLAVRLVGRIEDYFRQGARIDRLLTCNTVAEMATVLFGESDKRLADIQTSETVSEKPDGQPNFFCVSDRGFTFHFRHLIRYLKTKPQIYTLPIPGIEGQECPFNQHEDIAACLIREIRKVQPLGPYYLGGYCVGGEIAYEIAQQLTVAGEEST